MSEKEITLTTSRMLIIFLMITFVVSAVFPDFTAGIQSVKIEEADMDGQESNEEKKESKEDKENINHDFRSSIKVSFAQESILKCHEHSSLLQELYLPVITPPPDTVTPRC